MAADERWRVVETQHLARIPFEGWNINHNVNMVIVEACASAHPRCRTETAGDVPRSPAIGRFRALEGRPYGDCQAAAAHRQATVALGQGSDGFLAR